MDPAQPATAPDPERASAAVAGDGAKIYQLRQEVQVVSDIMRDNMTRVIERDGRISDLVERSENLQESAGTYQRTTRAVRRKMWWQNTKMKIIIGVVIAVIVLIIITSIVGSVVGNQNNKGGQNG